MATITTKSSIDDDCLRLKICSLNSEGLRSIPFGFTSVDSILGLIKMIKKWISNILPQICQCPILARAEHAKEVGSRKS